MDIYLKITAAILITAVLSLMLGKLGADISVMLTVAVCCMVLATAVNFLSPVLEFAGMLMDLGNLNHELFEVLMKVVGIGLISQFIGLVCCDAGHQSLGKTLQIITNAVILCISLPLLEQMLSLIEGLLGEV